MLLEFMIFFDADDGAGAVKEVEKAPATQETPPKQAYKTFENEEEYNKALQSERSKAKHEILQKLGLESVEKGKENLTKAEELEQHLQKAISRLNQLEEENVLVKTGVQDEFKEEALTLARAKVSDEVSLEAALKQVTEKFPNLVSPQKKQGVEKVGAEKGKPNEVSDAERIIRDLNQRYRTNIKI